MPAGAGGQDHSSLSVLPGPVRTGGGPEPRETDPEGQAAYGAGALLACLFLVFGVARGSETSPCTEPHSHHRSPELPRMEASEVH